MPHAVIGAADWSLALDEHISCIAVAPDGRRVAIGTLAGDLVVLDVATGDLVAKPPGHPLGVLGAAWSPDGSRLASGGQDGTIRLCTPGGTPVAEQCVGGWVEFLAWSVDGVLAASAGRHLVLTDVDGHVRHQYPAVSSTITAVEWSDNAMRVGVASYGGLTWFDIDRLPDDRPARRHHFTGSPLSLALSPGGRWACAGFQDSSIHIWPLWSGDDLTMSGYPAKIDRLAFRHDGRWLASACLDEITVWDFSGRGPRGRRPAIGSSHDARITWLAWQPDGELLASGDRDGLLVLWPSPTSLRRPLSPVAIDHGGEPISTAAWTPQGDGLLVGRHDGTVELRPVR